MKYLSPVNVFRLLASWPRPWIVVKMEITIYKKINGGTTNKTQQEAGDKGIVRSDVKEA